MDKEFVFYAWRIEWCEMKWVYVTRVCIDFVSIDEKQKMLDALILGGLNDRPKRDLGGAHNF